jgi:translation elongation factor EF-Tu-like GTPase
MVSAKICFIENRTYYNHYRPMVKIRDDGMYNYCELIFKNRESVCSGEEIEVNIIFLVQSIVIDYLYKGKKFLMYEGQKIVGQGEITSI